MTPVFSRLPGINRSGGSGLVDDAREREASSRAQHRCRPLADAPVRRVPPYHEGCTRAGGCRALGRAARKRTIRDERRLQGSRRRTPGGRRAGLRSVNLRGRPRPRAAPDPPAPPATEEPSIMLKRILLALALAASVGGAAVGCNTPASSASPTGAGSSTPASTAGPSGAAPSASDVPSSAPSAS